MQFAEAYLGAILFQVTVTVKDLLTKLNKMLLNAWELFNRCTTQTKDTAFLYWC